MIVELIEQWTTSGKHVRRLVDEEPAVRFGDVGAGGKARRAEGMLCSMLTGQPKSGRGR